MGRFDAETKAYLSKNDIFADAFNFYVYNGEQVIKADELVEMDSTEIIVPYGNNAREPVQKYRDILKYWNIKHDNDAIYMALGIESQSAVHYAMPVKNLLYDAMNYARQVENAGKSYKKSRTRLTSSEFLSGFRKDDILLPVMTLVIYFGVEKWDAPLSLHEMFATTNEKLLAFIPNYRINLISPENISDVEFNKFQTGLGSVMQYIKHQNDKNLDWIYSYKRFESVDMASAMLINALTGSKLTIQKSEEAINVCYAYENSIREAEARGEARGEARATLRGENKMARLISCLLGDNRQEELREIAENSAKRQELYKFYGINE